MPFLTKHIVLYDTLLDQNTPEEVEAVLAHELGHWKFNHSFMMLIMGQILTFANLSLIRLTVFNPSLVSFYAFLSIDGTDKLRIVPFFLLLLPAASHHWPATFSQPTQSARYHHFVRHQRS
jgi:Zn-dependent protease with chaperone function